MADVNSGKEWSAMDVSGLRHGIERGYTAQQLAEFLCRDVDEVRAQARALALPLPDEKP
jgi:hypothetical protein